MSRRLAWPGFRNARDLGGLPLHPRGQTRFGELVRSDLPSGPGGLSVQTPVAYGVRTVIDLRTPRELLGKPSPLRQLPGYRHLPLLLDDDFDVVTAMRDLGRTYRWKVDNRGQAIAAILSFMAGAPSGGILFHCLAGMDRSGVVTALLLSLAGVDRASIIEDYLLSDGTMPLPVPPRPEMMADLLDHIDNRHGGVPTYLAAVGAGAATQAALRRRLLS